MKMNVRFYLLISGAAVVLFAMTYCAQNTGKINSGSLHIEVNDQMLTRVSTDFSSVPLYNEFQQSE